MASSAKSSRRDKRKTVGKSPSADKGSDVGSSKNTWQTSKLSGASKTNSAEGSASQQNKAGARARRSRHATRARSASHAFSAKIEGGRRAGRSKSRSRSVIGERRSHRAPRSTREGSVKTNLHSSLPSKLNYSKRSRKAASLRENGLQMHAMGLYGPLSDAVNRKNNVNFAFSPFSTKVALGIFLAATRGSTQREICELIGVAPDDFVQLVHGELQPQVERYMGTSDRFAGITIWHHLYTSGATPCSPGFLEEVKTMYNCSASKLDFQHNGSKDLVSIIHAGVSGGTEGKVTSLLHRNEVGPRIMLMMANVVYFDTKWATQFSKVGIGKFHTSPKKTVDVEMMNVHGIFKSFNIPKIEARAIEIPYDGEDFSMVFVLPVPPSDFATMEKALRDPLVDFFCGTESSEALLYSLTIPKFTVSCRVDMKEGLKDLGLRKMFRSKYCDLSGLTNGTNDFTVSSMMQKTVVTVGDAGKKKSVSLSEADADVASRFTCDQPFVFFIKDKKSTCIICAGRVMDPTS